MNGEINIDAVLPADMALKAETVGIKKATMPFWNSFVLSILAGAFIALGAIFTTTVSAGTMPVKDVTGTIAFSTALPYGVVRLLAGTVFSLGLILVVVGGAELFTGNNLIMMAFMNKKVSFGKLMRNWAIVFAGNFVGSIATAIIMFFSKQYTFGGGAIGLAALSTAESKASLGFVQAIALGIMCNALVCLAVWLCFSARSTTDKILSIIPPVAAFVAAGFEHSVANMYFLPIGLFIKTGGDAKFFEAIGKTPDNYPNLTWSNFFFKNLLPVTIGNIIGGALMVGVVYWFVYLRGKK
jgi:formate transporter